MLEISDGSAVDTWMAMDGGRRWFVGVGNGNVEKSVFDRIMQGFRPIAPKPTMNGWGSEGVEPAGTKTKTKTKRKYVRSNNGKRRKKKVERVQLVEALDPKRTILETWVTVERVTGSCNMNGRVFLLGNTDEEKMKNLEVDTCPGFISVCGNKVEWVNMAYKKMAWGDKEGHPRSQVTVRLVVKEEELAEVKEVVGLAFLVRVQTSSVMSHRHDYVVPCDVWKMEFGGFAWRLDLEAALCLGRLLL